mmetsp:Transcript_12101/g.17372  ORF Transcript_12101/g.17372 Transcript_12101/m.17372 type:complete len:186 (-) Transcript_12101:68-625(-)|eukprot:CAMPEP_0202476370 /NCGR_PEP_ID=MMETSP1360-20130828/93388_1 /ASSEMBLY_ACC=CAM_ASM_000848 /TAXON_ID=515479 /ORGANISM="Licmophora paradoxa, Strain CCMP2313" /LENGTH=185 /DNA_ID=CAMNT_0049103573 /DNA_START=793 /DNA_END=1350 /DNA_ORIENTATION=-
MPDPVTSATLEQVPSTDTNRNQGNRGTRHNNNQRTSRFDGACEALKGHVYDITAGKDTFLKTTRKVAEYVNTEYTHTGEFRKCMIELELPTITQPDDPPDSPSFMQMEKWKIAIRKFEKKSEQRKSNSYRVYGLVIGQCSQALLNRLESHVDWNTTDSTSSVIGLLKTIQVCMTQRQTRKNEVLH